MATVPAKVLRLPASESSPIALIALFVGLITRRSEVRILPPLLPKRQRLAATRVVSFFAQKGPTVPLNCTLRPKAAEESTRQDVISLRRAAMASLKKRPGNPIYYIQFYVGSCRASKTGITPCRAWPPTRRIWGRATW
jgi:hypothetical protein